MFDENKILEALVKGMRDGVIELPPDVLKKIEEAHARETNETAKNQLEAILTNIK
ncbi:MAG: fumarate hydratase, partial [Thermoplasmata archaeon]|nr:fumarate hydratase [Thermoplasmata archaeon]